MADERVFKITIDGLEKSYKDTVKLLDALNSIKDVHSKVTVETDKVNKATSESTNRTKEKTKALTDEEKAQKKLKETQEKASKPISELEKAQERANLQLKERSKLLRQQVSEENAVENSIAQMKAELKKLNDEWNNVDMESDRFKELTEEIDKLTTKLKEAEAAKGTFTRNVGNYPEHINAINESFEKLGNGIDKTSEDTKGMLSLFQAGVGIALMFDEENNELSNTMNSLGKIMAIVGVLQQANNILLTKGALASKGAAIMEGVHALQIRARAISMSLATKETVLATIAQRIFNSVAKANPYLLLATALISVIGAVAAYRMGTDEATESTKKYTSSLDGVSYATEEAKDAHDQHLKKLRDLQIEYRVLIGDLTNYEAKLLQLNNTLKDEITKNRENTSKELDSLNNEYDSFLGKLGKSFSNYVAGKDNNVSLEAIEREKQKKRKAIIEDSQQKEIDLQEQHNANLKNEEEKHIQERIELQNKLTSDLKIGLDKELFDLKTQKEASLKEAKDKGLESTIVNEVYAKKETEIRDKYTKQNAEKAKQASDKVKQNVEKQKEIIKSLQKFQDDTSKIEQQNVLNRIKSNRELIKSIEEVTGSYEDQKAILREQSDENIKTVSLEYDELIKKAKEAAVDVSKLTEAKNERVKALEVQLSNELLSLEKERVEKVKEVNEKAIQNRQQLIGLEMAELDTFYNSIESKLDNLEVKNSGGIINVEATRKNIDEANKSLAEYLNYIQNSKQQIEQYYNEMLTHYDKDSIEYKQLLLDKENALLDFQKKENNISKEITDNTKTQTQLQAQYFQELASKMQEYVNNIMTGVNAVFDGINSVLQSQLDDANDKYDAISQKYDDVVAKREESSNRINELEEEAKSARGGRALVLQEQINSEMEANKQLANQEKDLAKEKEKQGKEIAKKERQMKKAQIASDIVSGISGTALAVINALQVKPFPLGVVLASVAGAMGGVQVGVMAKQLSKLEDGGLLNGKRHSNGGMRVEGTNIEVEGGEYVVNRQSTAKNIGLIRYINNERRELKPSDINSFFARSSKGFEPPFKRMFETGGQLPAINTSVNVDNEILIDAIRSMKIEPKVDVKDINKVQEDVVKVDNWTGL